MTADQDTSGPSEVKTHDVTATSTISGCSTKTASKSAGAIWWQQKWNNNLLLQSTTKSFPPRYPQYWQKWITSAGPATLLQEACIPEILCTWSPPSSGPLCTSTHLNRSKQHHQFAASHRSLRVHPHHSSNLWRNNSSESKYKWADEELSDTTNSNWCGAVLQQSGIDWTGEYFSV